MDKVLIKKLVSEINIMADKEIKIMEVCGTHTHMISKFGIRSILNPNIKLISGPGCPVCVTDEYYIDSVIDMINSYDVTIATFGDLLKVNGTKSSLMNQKSNGKDIIVIHSPLDLVNLAKKNKDKNIIFLAVGFETTAPVIALTIKQAFEEGVNNLFFHTSLKLMEPILKFIFKDNTDIEGLISPGHVASVKGANYFKFLEDYNVPSAICGFEALDIIKGIHFLVNEITNDNYNYKNLYTRCVKEEGNEIANELLKDVFEIKDENWRGIGIVKNSALSINDKYKSLDATKRFNIKSNIKRKVTCLCGDIILGKKSPNECKLFNKRCNPTTPYGPCMVSSEGSCRIAYRYKEEY